MATLLALGALAAPAAALCAVAMQHPCCHHDAAVDACMRPCVSQCRQALGQAAAPLVASPMYVAGAATAISACVPLVVSAPAVSGRDFKARAAPDLSHLCVLLI